MEILYSPVKGCAIKLEKVNDEMFSQKMLGDGIAVIPENDEFASPIDGEITLVYETQHAIAIKTEKDTEILIHIGIDTMNLEGEPFDTKVKVGDKVKKGDLLTRINWSIILKKGLEKVVPIIVLNKEVQTVDNNEEIEIEVGDPLLSIE
ncbi:glucose-specific phosphotransferase system IIA component [Breznakia sp. PF5-3]|uniref:PTS sugar transporter subunit IIA n=1 Tax=unclassified Breznakia TaxID=2623764 RepID=UPI002405F8C4|nr:MULTISPECIES: PTS glucose transporter subunit IIA [unclassified Breznakia]MDF9824204.1 glucose-specific phosphotransferase system IIA component [Breznakia sp. PM6-1]MDF9835002.1 glucose-specific phosphotransferase system IIA component [Breznakia sp. PF5-3]MDF9837247.1 glucose-specific phosphotransferase system IIA component [Breznakia sp. PFB2-8]MDF9859237.1 glucose-specific phosphotransferase system IIA component [Breznakia sp. PH5-24]